jgi:hypothetical protein
VLSRHCDNADLKLCSAVSFSSLCFWFAESSLFNYYCFVCLGNLALGHGSLNIIPALLNLTPLQMYLTPMLYPEGITHYGITASTSWGTKCGTGKGIHKTDKQEYILLIIHMWLIRFAAYQFAIFRHICITVEPILRSFGLCFCTHEITPENLVL